MRRRQRAADAKSIDSRDCSARATFRSYGIGTCSRFVVGRIYVWVGDRNGSKTIRLLGAGRSRLARNQTPYSLDRRRRDYETDTVIGMSLSAFLAGERRFTRLFRPANRRALQEFGYWTLSRRFAFYAAQRQ